MHTYVQYTLSPNNRSINTFTWHRTNFMPGETPLKKRLPNAKVGGVLPVRPAEIALALVEDHGV